MPSYIMEDETEGKRILVKTQRVTTLEHLKIAGLEKGMHSLDVGCASGKVTREMAGIVFPAKVIGFDASHKRIIESKKIDSEKGITNIDYICGDVYSIGFDDNQFDFVWSRFLFEYLQDPLSALKELKRITKPGHKVVVADLDGNGVFHYPMSKKLSKGISAVINIIKEKAAFDPYAGRKLYNYFYRVDFKNISVTTLPYHLIFGKAVSDTYSQWQTKIDILERNIIKLAPDKYKELKFVFKEMLAHLQKPDTLTYSTLFIVEGIK